MKPPYLSISGDLRIFGDGTQRTANLDPQFQSADSAVAPGALSGSNLDEIAVSYSLLL